MRCLHLLFYIFLLSGKVNAQSNISGKILDYDNKPCSSATVLLKDKEDNILVYTVSDTEGEFVLKVNNSLIYPVTLAINAMGHLPYNKKLEGFPKEYLRIDLELQTQDLNEHIVKYNPPIKSSKDTLEYNVESFTSKNDLVIGDVLKKIPGIRVDSDGKIFYQGQEINKYYIEGLDMLGKRYNLANDNISAFHVEKIQVLENHQPLQVLDGVKHSNQAALNLKLKRNVTYTGQVDANVGAAPFLWEGKFSPMIFSRKLQGMFLAQSNNIGKNLSKYDFSKELSDLGGLSSSRWIKNKALIFSGNSLFKTKNNLQVKTGFLTNFLNENFRKDTYSEIVTSDENIILMESLSSHLRSKNYSGNVILEKNTKRLFFENNLLISWRNGNRNENTTLNSNLFSQLLQTNGHSLSNSLRLVLPIKDNFVTISSKVVVEDYNYPLLIKPGVFSSLISDGVPYQETIQLSGSKNTIINNRLSYLLNLKNTLIETALEHNFSSKNTLSEIQWQKNDSLKYLGLDFINNQSLKEAEVNFYMGLDFRFKDLIIKTIPKFSYLSYSIIDRIKIKESSKNKPAFEPGIAIVKNFGSLFVLNVGANRNSRFGSGSNINSGYKLSGFRQINRFDYSLIEDYISYSYSVRLEFKEVFSSTFAHIHLSKSFINSDLTEASLINSGGQTLNSALIQKNKKTSTTISGEIGKYFSSLRTTFRLSPGFNSFTTFSLINEDLAEIDNSTLHFGSYWTSSVGKYLNFSGTHVNSFSKSTFLNTQFRNTHWSHRLDVSLHLFEKHSVSLVLDLYTNRNALGQNDNTFLDAVYRVTLINKWKFKVQLNNILNNNQYFTREFNQNSLLETTYDLRPTQAMIGLELSLK